MNSQYKLGAHKILASYILWGKIKVNYESTLLVNTKMEEDALGVLFMSSTFNARNCEFSTWMWYQRHLS